MRTCPARRIGDTISGVKAGARVSLAGALFFGLLSGCQASLSADANASANGQGASAEGDAELNADASGKGEGQGEMTRSALASQPPNANETTASDLPASRVLLGARHDLKLKPGKGTASCECLSVALGGARSGGMAWSAVPPAIDEGTQLSIALSSEGQTCKGEPKQSLGASYWGYRISGNDVIVLVEAARGGRPLTSGAIIPKPVAASAVYPALVMAVSIHEERRAVAERLQYLEERVRMRPLVHAAVEKLRAARGVDEERAYAMLRDCAMRRRLSMEQVSAIFLGGLEPLPEVG